MSTEEVTRPLAKKNSDRDDTLPLSGEPGSLEGELPFGGAIGRYLVLSVLGHGGMGIVYAAYDPALDRKIAVKLLRGPSGDDATEGRSRMQREAQALARLSHPNVITVHDVNEHRGAIYIAMELVIGGTLLDWQGGKGWREVVDAYASAARGLAAAHGVGLIHRDFKPDNVLVGEDGRVRVTDFGLARLASQQVEAPADPKTSPSKLASNLTEAGSVMGTPRYMAPEQIDGGPVDARTDQFAWCVALWEALYGEQPFPHTNLATRSAAIKTDPPKVPASAQLPRGIARVLTRGLSAEPGQRWPSLDALLAELDRVTSPRRGLIGGVAAVAAAGVLGAVLWARGGSGSEQVPSCDAAGTPIDAVWSVEKRGAVEVSFDATKVAFAGDAFRSLDRAIDGWRTRWRDTARDNCRATRITRTQSEAMLDLRNACLERRRDELQTIVNALEKADAQLVEHARTLALPDLEACSDAVVLVGTTAPPSDPEKAKERAAIEKELAALEGELVDGLPLDRAKAVDKPSAELVNRATALGWAPLTAHAQQTRADVERELGKGKAARSTLIAAASSASIANDLDRLVSVYTDLSDVEARLTSDYALGHSWTVLAEGTLSRLGPRTDKLLRILRERSLVALKAGRLEDARAADEAALAVARTKGPNAELEVTADLGYVLGELGELDAAIEHLDRARDMALKELGPNHPKLAAILHDRGTITYRRGKYADAEQQFREALVVREKAYGPDDIAVATTVQAIGIALTVQGKVADAQPYLDRALKIQEARLGADHPDVANALNDIGGAYHQAGDYQRELEIGMKALAIREKALGPDHPDVGQSLVNTAIASKNLGKWDIVEPHYLRAIAIFEKAHGPGHINTAITRLNFAEALRVRGKLTEAAAEYEKARVVFAKQLGEDHPLLAHIWNGVGQLELARGKLAEAVPLLERAVALREKEPGDAPALAESRFALARALGKTNARAKTLATQAREGFVSAGKGFAKQVAEIDAWLR